MPQNADLVYRTSAQIVQDVLNALMARIPDASIGPDAIFNIWAQVFANTVEGLYLAQQLLHDDMFPQTASALALIRYGEEYGRPQKTGTIATGSVRFSGSGGTYIPIGSVVSAPRPSLNDSLDFLTTVDGTIPNPGLPDQPTVADLSVAGALTGTFEWAITFLTSEGETELGTSSDPLILAASKAHLSAIPIGGPGTTKRRVYRRVNGSAWGFLVDIADNTTTVYDDNNAATGIGTPPDVSTAERISLAAQASDPGVDYNAAIGTIVDLADAPPNLSDVINLVPFTGGTDAEDIENFRTELLSFIRAPMSGSASDLEVWALTVDGVESATAFPNIDHTGASAPGTVTVRIAGPGGTIPSGGVVAAALAELLSHDLANITIEVATFVAHAIDVDVTLTLTSGYVTADVSSIVTQAIVDYLNSVPVGGTVYTAGIYHAVFTLAGVDTLVVTTPGADVVLGATEKATEGTITVGP